jgi:hypothetical protein
LRIGRLNVFLSRSFSVPSGGALTFAEPKHGIAKVYDSARDVHVVPWDEPISSDPFVRLVTILESPKAAKGAGIATRVGSKIRLVRDDEKLAEIYRDDLTSRFRPIDVIIIGGKRSIGFPADYDRLCIKNATYESVISEAPIQLEWLLKQLTTSDGRS